MTMTHHLPMRTVAAITDAGIRCILCDRMWPKDEMPLWHTFLISATEPVATCSCDSHPEEPRWHGFDVINSYGCLVAAGVVCPQCIAAKGLETAVTAAGIKAMCADKSTN